MQPNLEGARKDVWDCPEKDGMKGTRPTSLGRLVRKSKWEKPLADWMPATGVGLVGPEMCDTEAPRVGRKYGWRLELFLLE
jgi:hypothetical protein